MQQRPKEVFWGPRGLVAAASYRMLQDADLPVMEMLTTQLGLANWDKDFSKSTLTLKLKNGAEILFRTLDDFNKIRGPEFSWAFIDEGRQVNMEAWKVVIGRLRQKGYEHHAWVSSTPNGHDWMWKTFHPDSPDQWKQARWYGAPTHDNRENLPDGYIESLEAGYEGRFYEQEILGHFVGVVEGAVFPYWDARKHLRPLAFRPELPVYTGWDFGFGDPGVDILVQIEWKPKQDSDRVEVPWLYILDAVEAAEWTSAQWAEAHKGLLEVWGLQGTKANFGDPAGRQRQGVTGSSYIEDLTARGVEVIPARKKPQDYSLRILNNMMAGGRVIVNSECEMGPRVAAAIAEHRWNIDVHGTRIGTTPVHDWTSHFVDALRYLATELLAMGAREREFDDTERVFNPNQYGYVFQQLLEEPETGWLGQPERTKRPRFEVPAIQPRS